MKKNLQAGFTILELMVVMIVIAILSAIGFVAYTKYIENAKVSKLTADLKEYGNAILSFYSDTGQLVGIDNTVPFPNALANSSYITDNEVKDAWKGPYIKTIPTCPFTGCRYEVDYTTGQATTQGQVYQYFVVARNVPLKQALEIARNMNGDKRMKNNECVVGNVSQVVNGTLQPCAIYLSNTTGGSNAKVDVYYTFSAGSY